MEPKESLRDHILPIQPKLVVNHVLNTMSNLKIGPSSRSLKSVSSWLLKNIFWLVIYLLGSCLTIWLCLSLLNDYSKPDNILTSVEPNMAKIVTLHNITVCVPFNATVLFLLNSSSATPYSDAIEDFFNKTIENGKFNTTNYIEEWKMHNSPKNISNATLFILYKYLTIMHEAEYLREAMENPFANLSWQPESDQNKALLNILVPQIQQMNITTDEIKNVFIEYFKIGSKDNWGDTDGGILFCMYRESYDEICQCHFFDTISYLDHNQICFEKHNISLQAEDELLNHIFVQINDNSHAIKATGRKIIFNFNEDATPPNFATTDDGNSIIEMIPGDHTNIYIDFESIYRTLPIISNGKLRCSYPTRRECEEKYCISLIKAMCGCTPVTFTIGQSDENKCTFAHYEKCLNYSGKEDEERQKSCPVSCNQTNYKISNPYVFDTGYSSTLLTITLNKYDYLIYEEYIKWTFLEFISAIGGALAIWFGLDFIVLIQFIFTLMAKVFPKVLSFANLEVATGEDNQFYLNGAIIKNLFTALNIEVPPRFTRVSLALWSIGKFLWAVIYLAGGVFTAKSCFDLCERYVSGEMKTSMQVSFNRSISLPPATLCLRHNILYYNINPSFAPSSNYTNKLSEYLNQKNISKESILRYDSDGSSWPPVMVYVVYKYLSVLHKYEYYDFQHNEKDTDKYPINEWQNELSKDLTLRTDWADEYCCDSSKDDDFYSSTYSSNYSSSYSSSYDCWWTNYYMRCKWEIEAAHNLDCSNAIENVLIPKLTELNITVEELRQKTLYQLNSDAQLTFRFYGSNKNTVINNLRAATFGLQSYCMYIPLDNFEYTSGKDYAETALKSNKIIKEKMIDPIILSFDTTFSDLGGSVLLGDKENREQTMVGSIYGMDFGESKSFSVRINYELALDPNSQKCANFNSKEEWDMLYRIKYTEELCNCSPISWPELLPSTSRMCTLEEYKTCLIFNESSWFYNDTLRSITSRLPCEKIKKDITENEINDNETSIKNTSISRIRICVEDFVYLTIKEEMEMTFVDFAVAFGGTLGILLGLDFRFFAWLVFMPPFFLISQLLNKLLYKKAFFFKPMKNTKLKIALNAQFVRLITGTLDLDLSDVLKLTKFAFIKKMFRNIYWLIYHTAGGVLTFLLFNSVVINYLRNNDAKITFKPMNNESISLPSPTICLPFLPLKTDSDPDQRNITSTTFIQNYLSGKTKRELLRDEWDHAFINYMHSYIVQYEIYEWFSSDDLPKNMDHSEFLDIIDDMVNVMDITLEELREKFGREFANMYQLNIVYYANTSEETTETLNIHTVFVEESKICYKPSTESLTFNSFNNFLGISANRKLMRKSGKYFENFPPITIDLNGRNTNKKGATILDATVSGNFSNSTTIALEIDTIIKAYPLVSGEVRCSNDLSLDQCRSSCVAETIQNTCKCLPSTITLMTSFYENARFCTLADYNQCNSALQSDAFACLDGCLEPCERIRFSATSSIDKSALESMNGVEVNLRIGSFKYQYMEEQLTYTTEEFIGEIGGALGLFLGLSVLMFLEFFYALFVRLCDICVTKKWANVQPLPKVEDNVDETSL